MSDFDVAGETHKIPMQVQVEAPIFSVQLPTALPTYITAEGESLTAQDAFIKNNSNKAIQITDIKIETKGDWELVEYGGRVLENQFGLCINDITSTDGNFEWEDFKLQKTESLGITYAIQMPGYEEGLEVTDIADISIIVDWYEAVHEISSTGDVRYDGRTIVTMDEPLQLNVQQVFSLRPLVFQSSDESIATVSEDGLVTAVRPGECIITYGEAEFPISVYGTPIAASRSNINLSTTTVDIPSHYRGADDKWYTITSIADSAFYSITSTHKISLPDTITKVGDSAFYGASKVTISNLPDSITYIGIGAFYQVGAITDDLPSALTYLGNTSFSGSGIKGSGSSLTIPSSLEYWGAKVFEGAKCDRLSSIKIYTNIAIPSYTFCNLESEANCKYYIPRYCKGIGDYAFSGSYGPDKLLKYEGSTEEWATIPMGKAIFPTDSYGLAYNQSF